MNVFVGDVDPLWHDMSTHVDHFIKAGQHSAYDNIMSILYNKRIEARNPFGIGYKKAPDISSQKCVCFSEVPPHLMSRIAAKRSKFGVGFHKDFVVHRYGNPIMYAYKDSPLLVSLGNLMAESSQDPNAEIWKISPFVDPPGKYKNKKYFFEWEREWRKVGHFSFDVDDVAFLVIPEADHEAARQFFEDAESNVSVS
jgi:hypothetical protein